MGDVRTFFTELRRRKIWWVGGVYLAASWLIMQVIGFVETPLRLPDWADTLAIVLLIAGLPVAIILAWAQESQAAPVAIPETEGDASDINPKTVAVLPFENLSIDPDHAYFATGIHEEVLNQLAKIHDLDVIARTSVQQYLETKKTIPEIASELSVANVMEGSVRYAGDRVRVTAQLIDGATNLHLWSENFDRVLEDVFAIQSEIALGIASALRATLTSDETAAIRRAPTENAEAYNAYLLGQSIIREGGVEAGSEAVIQFDRAIELDPEFAAPYARRAVFQGREPDGLDGAAMRRRLENGLQLADRSLELDPTLAEGFHARAVLLRYSNDWTGAEIAARRAVELEPNNSTVLMGLAMHLAHANRAKEALPFANRSVELDPFNANCLMTLMLVLGHLGQFESAADAGRRATSLGTGIPLRHFRFAMNLKAAGRESDAAHQLELAETMIAADDVQHQVYLGIAWATLGNLERSDQLLAGRDPGLADPVAHAEYLLVKGDREGALAALEQAYARTGFLPVQFYASRRLRPLITEPRFLDLARKVGHSV